MINFKFAVLLALVPAISQAKELRYKDYPVDMQDGDRVVVQGFRGSVKLSPSTSKQMLVKVRKFVADKASAEEQARFDAMSFAVRRENGVVYIEAKGADAAGNLASWYKPGAPEMGFEIEAPPSAFEVLMHEGPVTVQSWKSPLAVNLIGGSLKTTGMEGTLRAQLQRGDIKIDKHRGRVEVDSYGAKLTINDMEGELDLTNFAGDSAIHALKGSVDARTNSGGTTVAKSSGSFDFLAARGPVTLTEYEGPVRGSTDQATVIAQILGEAEVNIESNQGTVSVRLPEDSGASVKLASEEGTIALPDKVRSPASLAGQKNASIRLEGEGPKGTVNLRSKTGVVRVRL